MSNLKNIENLIKHDDIIISFEEGRYSDGFFIGIDFPYKTGECYDYHKRECIREYIDEATAPDDELALKSEAKLIEFANIHNEFLFTVALSLDDGLRILDEKAKLWLELDYDKQTKLLDEFISFRN